MFRHVVFYRKIHCLTSEFRVKFHTKKLYRMSLRKTVKCFTVVKKCIQRLRLQFLSKLGAKVAQESFKVFKIFARDSRQQYRFMHKSNSPQNTIFSSLPLAMRFCVIPIFTYGLASFM